MSPERWRKVEELYHSALEQSPEQRSTFLVEACQGDDALRREVENLLRHEGADGVLDAPAWGAGDNPDRIRLTPGSRLGPYKIVALLGAGGMGEVYRALDTRLDRTVAIKLMPTDRAPDGERKRRFIQEAKAASALNHPNIVAIHDILTEGTTDLLVMEYVPGKSLDRLIGPKGLRTNEALEYAIQIADALSASHTAGIVHRDLKPSNVMIAGDDTSRPGTVKLLDFGIAKLTENTQPGGEDAPGTMAGAVLGTAPYMSPEQAKGRTVDARSDIFSFGAMLYEMITGRRAFHGDSELSTLNAIVREDPVPIVQVRPDLPPEIEKIIQRCIRKDPARRFQTAADLKVALQELKEELDSGKGMAVRPEQRRRPKPSVAMIAGLTLSLIAVIAAWQFGGKPRNAVLTAIPLTTYPGSERYPTLSPDGSQVSFTWSGEDQSNQDIYVKMVSSGGPKRLTTDPAEDFSPAWSPDGSSIAFMRRLPGGMAAVMLIAPLGGIEKRLAVTRNAMNPMWMVSRTLAWTPDGKHLAILDKPDPTEPPALFLQPIDGGEKRRLTHPPSKTADRDPTFSPNGRMLTFVRNTSVCLSELFVRNLSFSFAPEGEPKQLTFDNRCVVNPAWTSDGRQIVFSSNRAGGIWSLWKISPQGGEPQRLASVGEDGWSSAISTRGNRLVYSRAASDYNIWRVELPAAHTGTAFGRLNKSSLAESSRDDRAARLSPDRKRMAFESDRSGAMEVWVSDSTGRNSEPMTNFGTYSGSPRWSPDGNRIAFDTSVDGHWEIHVTNADGGRPKRLTFGSAGNWAPAWSQDGKWIYFVSNSSGQPEVWKVLSTGGEPGRVTWNGGGAAMESSDGFLYYKKGGDYGNGGLWRAPLDGRGEPLILEAVTARAFDVVKDGIYFMSTGDSGTSLQFYSFATKKTIPIDSIEKPIFLTIDVSPDGRSLLYSQHDRQPEDLMLVENFR